ncbi:flavin monoamine oxidase family protein [Amycolatopsis jejuensis]|uniref:flavin monoamine oxidase family protein n=1 Tax=Amycolatopsis jejuensis TaxID=330084 RepID=UPI00052725F7|nr:NAD(P)/FAD-dependent oxidoreductase [Amycolatopsis jejuensis]
MNGDTYDVLVLGAGFAGLTAARDLAADGKRVLIVEARDRIGGRAWYRPFADTGFSIELGGNWVDPDGNTELMAEAERYGVALSQSPHPEHHVSLLDGILRHAACPITDDDRAALDQLVKEVLVQVERIDPELPLDQQDVADLDVPLHDYLDRFGLSTPLRGLIGGWIRENTGCAEAQISALHLMSWIPNLNGDVLALGHTPTHRFAAGTIDLLQRMLDDSGAELRLSSPVAAVTQSADHVEVRTHNGEVLRARGAVIALPLNCLTDIAFEPALSPEKAAGAAIGQSGAAKKLWALVTDLPPKVLGVGCHEAPIDVFFTDYPAAETGLGGDLVVGFSTQERPLDILDREDLEAALRRYLPEASVLKVDGHDWLADPYAKGTWCAAPAGLLSKYASALEATEGRLVFAGSDIAHAFRGWMEGAVRTGAIAATRLSAILAER